MSIKEKYFVKAISKYSSKKLLDKYHYLHKTGGFRSGINYGLFDVYTNELIGVIVYHTVSAKEVAKGCFGIETYNLAGFMELGRLCLNPHRHEKNITSYFVATSIKLLRKKIKVVAILSYADSEHHNGYIYQACNFEYYGLTSPKKDFYIDLGNGNTKKLQRGKCRHLKGNWVDKSQKHRYLLIYDKYLKSKWIKQPYPKGEQNSKFNSDKTNQEDQSFIPKETLQIQLF